MEQNDADRDALADAGLAVLARQGWGGLTHGAVDEEAHVPAGTAARRLPGRDALVATLLDRIGARLAPSADELANSAGPPSRALLAAGLQATLQRLSEDRELALALFELRLESARRPETAALLGPWLRGAFEADLASAAAAGLPASHREIALLHCAIDGLLLDRLTTPVAPGVDGGQALDALVDALLPER